MEKVYDIFISYRHNGGFETAKHLNDLLVGDRYTVSFDKDNLREGRFDEHLLSRIEYCTDFVLIVDQHCFDKTLRSDSNPSDDWLRTELSYALKLKKNIVPVMLTGAFFPQGLPKDLVDVTKYNGPIYSKEYFDSFYKKLIDFLHSHPHANKRDSLIQHVPSISSHYLKVECNMDCLFYVDGEITSQINANKIEKVLLRPGDYQLQFVSKENDEDKIVEYFTMANIDTWHTVDLKAVKELREEEEKKQELLNKKRIEKEEESRKKEKARQIAEEKQKIREKGYELFSIDGVPLKMLYIEGGNFIMGTQEDGTGMICKNEIPAHHVSLSDFFIGETEVTQELWIAIMGSNPSRYRYKDLPVETVSWYDVQVFISKLNVLTNREFRLPTEAEWEYAARGGSRSKKYKYSGGNNIKEISWNGSTLGTNHVKSKKPNELGLYDMSGNVWEWCFDWFGVYSGFPQINPTGPKNGQYKVFRGGSWAESEKYCRSTNRNYKEPTSRDSCIGFRLAMIP